MSVYEGRMEDFIRRFPWITVLPQSVQSFFFGAVYDGGENNPHYEHADNFRYAALTDPKALADFQARHDKGCCGSREEIIEDGDGKLWIVGFNYGH